MDTRIRRPVCIVIILLIAFSCENELVEVPVTSIKIVTLSSIIEVGLTDSLQLEVLPHNTTNKNYSWSSSDPSIAEVDRYGVVRGISPGVANITISTEDNQFTATNTVHVIRWTYYYMDNVPVRPVVIDSQDNVWCGGIELTRFINNSKLVYPAITNISAIAGNNEENIWLGTYNLGIWNFDGTNWTNYNERNSNLAYNSINYNSMILDLKGNLWFGTLNEGKGTGVTMFDGSQWHVFNSNNGLASNVVKEIDIDNEGRKWFVTRNGISSFDDSNWVSYTSEYTGINLNDQFFSIAIDKENNKWFGSYGGALKFDGSNWIDYNASNSDLKWNSINDIAVDQDNNIWFATENGVSKFDGTNWINYTSVKEMNYDVYNVRAIAIDSKGDKWLGTSYGVIKLED